MNKVDQGVRKTPPTTIPKTSKIRVYDVKKWVFVKPRKECKNYHPFKTLIFNNINEIKTKHRL